MTDLQIIRDALDYVLPKLEDEHNKSIQQGFSGSVKIKMYQRVKRALKAIDRMEKQEPSAWLFEFNNGKSSVTRHAGKAAEIRRYLEVNEYETVLYTAPPATPVVPDAVVKDAERYRWLRNPQIDVAKVLDKVVGEMPYDEGTKTGGYAIYEYRAGHDLDEAIDDARLAAAPNLETTK